MKVNYKALHSVQQTKCLCTEQTSLKVYSLTVHSSNIMILGYSINDKP